MSRKLLQLDDFRDILKDVRFRDWRVVVNPHPNEPARLYMQVRTVTPDNMDPNSEPVEWGGRKYDLSPYMCKSEVVRTAYLAIKKAMDHEVDEQFTYRGLPIYDPHFDVDKLWELRNSDDWSDTRDGSMTNSDEHPHTALAEAMEKYK